MVLTMTLYLALLFGYSTDAYLATSIRLERMM